MPLKDKKERQQYINKWRRESRRKRGLKKQGRKVYTEEQKIEARKKRKSWEKGWRLNYHEYKPEKKLLWSATKRARERGLDVNITEQDIKVPERCPYLDIPLVIHRARGDPRRDIASLDRIDNTKGYVKGNIEVISWLANSMKQNASVEDLQKFATEILRRYPIG